MEADVSMTDNIKIFYKFWGYGHMYDREIHEVIDKLAVFNKMYDIMRFVDPVNKKNIKFNSSSDVIEGSVNCFDFWGKSKACDNCISIRAFNENQTFIKVDYSHEKVFLITAIPFEFEGRRVVIELLKDTTNSFIFENGEKIFSSGIYTMIDIINTQVLKDPLTEIYNRRYINEKLPIDLINAVLAEREIAIIMADIDFFKKVNDTYGHLAGDEVLKFFASTISGCLKRESDWVARFGGEEFLICLPGVGIKESVEIAEIMRKELESKEIIVGEKIIKITASFGVSCIKATQGSTIEKLIDDADKKLYLAKDNGRNRVEY